MRRYAIIREFATYKELIKQADERFAQKLGDLEQRSKAGAADLHDGFLDEYWDFHSEEYRELGHSKRIMMASLFVGTWGLFEARLLKVCQSVDHRHENRLGLKDKTNYSMKRAKEDLKKLCVTPRPMRRNGPRQQISKKSGTSSSTMTGC